MSGSLAVVRPGALTFVVDRGRFGARHLGVAWCGAADAAAFEAANFLVGNDANAAALEITLGNASFRFEAETVFALTGADAHARLDERFVEPWRAHRADADAVLQLAFPQRGARTVLAVAGGIDVPPVLGSRTTDLAAGFGGLHGRALRASDVLALGQPAHPLAQRRVDAPAGGDAVRVVAFDRFAHLDAASQQAFWECAWTAGHESNRMGYRFSARPLRYEREAPPSHAVFPGFIQVPPSGEAIVLLADAQTTGGYPSIGVVHPEDLGIVAQLRPGETLRFERLGAP